MKNGSPVYLSARFIPAVLEGGNPGITVLFENITEQRRAEIALRENERFLFNILQVSPTPQFFINLNHKIVFWNRAMEIMTKLKEEEMMGTTLQWKAFYPDPRPCLADVLLNDNATRSGQLQGKENIIPKNPEKPAETTEFFPASGPCGRWLRCTATLIRDTNGNITGVMESLEDVTDVKQREFQVDSGSLNPARLSRTDPCSDLRTPTVFAFFLS